MSKLEEYRMFLRSNFPNSSTINNSYIYNIYGRVCENNLSTDIFTANIKYSLGTREECIMSLFNKYREQFNRLLIILPINDIYSVNFYMRTIVENLLKLTYSLNFDEELLVINNLKFRRLNESLKELDSIEENYKESIITISRLYGSYSNLLHNKDNYGSEIEIMEQIIKSDEVKLRDIDNDLMQILKAYQTIIATHFKIEECSLTTAQKIKINKGLSNSRASKFKNNLFKNNYE